MLDKHVKASQFVLYSQGERIAEVVPRFQVPPTQILYDLYFTFTCV